MDWRDGAHLAVRQIQRPAMCRVTVGHDGAWHAVDVDDLANAVAQEKGPGLGRDVRRRELQPKETSMGARPSRLGQNRSVPLAVELIQHDAVKTRHTRHGPNQSRVQSIDIGRRGDHAHQSLCLKHRGIQAFDLAVDNRLDVQHQKPIPQVAKGIQTAAALQDK